MADVRPFRALRYTSRADPALAIAPPYDVISPAEQAALYERSSYNVVRIEYGVQRENDTPSDNRYTRAAADLARWRTEGVLAVDAAATIYLYTQDFEWNARQYSRRTYFCALRLEEWEKGIVKPHEHTLAKPKADRLDLLRATRTHVSPVYSLFRPKSGLLTFDARGDAVYDFEADGQRHVISAITDRDQIAAFAQLIAGSDVYIADGHHRYETALAYRDEARARAKSWTGEEPENFVLMALTAHDDPGLVVLPTHRLVHGTTPPGGIAQLGRHFRVLECDGIAQALVTLSQVSTGFAAYGLEEDKWHVIVLMPDDRPGIQVLMPARESDAWKRLDVNVLQYGVLQPIFGIDDAALAAGGAVTYTQDAMEAQRAVASGEAACAFLLNATPVEQVLAVSDANGRMPQKSTYFHPKLPTGLVLRSLEVSDA